MSRPPRPPADPADPADPVATGSLETPVGRLHVVASPRGVRAVLWPDERPGRVVALGTAAAVDGPAESILQTAIVQLRQYFAGTRTEFDVPLDPVGTPFQRAVWEVLRTIPYGSTMTYGEQARRLGDANKARAVGAANGRNPISVIVPCHRVVGSNGSLTGFAGGLTSKEWLLAHERPAPPALDV